MLFCQKITIFYFISSYSKTFGKSMFRNPCIKKIFSDFEITLIYDRNSILNIYCWCRNLHVIHRKFNYLSISWQKNNCWSGNITYRDFRSIALSIKWAIYRTKSVSVIFVYIYSFSKFLKLILRIKGISHSLTRQLARTVSSDSFLLSLMCELEIFRVLTM